jgi:N-methylhydantoinase A
MADAIRVVTVERGRDPRGFVLLAAGGAAAQHASEIARVLGVGRFYVPRAASVHCALGLLAAEPTVDLVAPVEGRLQPLDHVALTDAVARLVGELGGSDPRAGCAEAVLAGASGSASATGAEQAAAGRRVVEATLDARYVGRHREFPLPLPLPVPNDGRGLRDGFDRLHRERFGHADPGAAVEYLALRVRIRTPVSLRLADTTRAGSAAASPKGARPVAFGGAPQPTPIFDGEALAPGAAIDGPAVVEDHHTTTLLWHGDRLTVDRVGGYRVELA